MPTRAKLLLTLATLAFAAGVRAQSNDIATGNMHFSAAEMDVNGDHMISKEEFMAYGGKKFDKMKDKNGMMTTADATKYFARGNPRPDAK